VKVYSVKVGTGERAQHPKNALRCLTCMTVPLEVVHGWHSDCFMFSIF